MAACSVESTAGRKAPITPPTSPRPSPPAPPTAPAPPRPRASPPSAWPRRPGRAAAARLQQRPVRLHAVSRVISVRGNWPLTPTMDVVVPYARTMADLLEVLDVVVADDADTRGDLWRLQPWCRSPPPPACAPPPTWSWRRSPRRWPASGSACRACSSTPTRRRAPAKPRHRRPDRPAHQNPRLGDRPVERRPPGPRSRRRRGDRGRLPAGLQLRGRPPRRTHRVQPRAGVQEFLHHELWDLSAWAFDDFLRANGDPRLNRLVDVDGPKIFPTTRAPCPTARATWRRAWTST